MTLRSGKLSGSNPVSILMGSQKEKANYVSSSLFLFPSILTLKLILPFMAFSFHGRV